MSCTLDSKSAHPARRVTSHRPRVALRSSPVALTPMSVCCLIGDRGESLGRLGLAGCRARWTETARSV